MTSFAHYLQGFRSVFSAAVISEVSSGTFHKVSPLSPLAFHFEKSNII